MKNSILARDEIFFFEVWERDECSLIIRTASAVGFVYRKKMCAKLCKPVKHNDEAIGGIRRIVFLDNQSEIEHILTNGL